MPRMYCSTHGHHNAIYGSNNLCVRFTASWRWFWSSFGFVARRRRLVAHLRRGDRVVPVAVDRYFYACLARNGCNDVLHRMRELILYPSIIRGSLRPPHRRRPLGAADFEQSSQIRPAAGFSTAPPHHAWLWPVYHLTGLPNSPAQLLFGSICRQCHLAVANSALGQIKLTSRDCGRSRLSARPPPWAATPSIPSSW
jgi:hypothetical protein